MFDPRVFLLRFFIGCLQIVIVKAHLNNIFQLFAIFWNFSRRLWLAVAHIFPTSFSAWVCRLVSFVDTRSVVSLQFYVLISLQTSWHHDWPWLAAWDDYLVTTSPTAVTFRVFYSGNSLLTSNNLRIVTLLPTMSFLVKKSCLFANILAIRVLYMDPLRHILIPFSRLEHPILFWQRWQ